MNMPREIADHLVIQELLGLGDVPRDPEELAGPVATLPALEPRQSVGQAFVSEIVLVEREDGVQLASRLRISSPNRIPLPQPGL